MLLGSQRIGDSLGKLNNLMCPAILTLLTFQSTFGFQGIGISPESANNGSVGVSVCMCVHMCVCICAYLCIFLHACTRVGMCWPMHASACMCACRQIWTKCLGCRLTCGWLDE